MKRFIAALALALATTAPIAAQADTMAPTAMSSAQMTAMHAKLSQAEKLIAAINKSYNTQFAIGPKTEAMAMAHMAMANMEMAKAMMEMQELWTGTPSALAYPVPEGGQ